MEMAYRLVVDDSAYIQNIRENVLTLITPIVEVDGRDRMVDLYNWSKKNPQRQVPPLLYWGKYVAHDNNRDAIGVTLKLTENVLNTVVGWHVTVLHDLHESAPYLYDNTVLAGAYNAWIDPLLTNEWHMIGWNNVQEMTRMGMPGVYAVGTWDNWSPGYLFFLAATHNGICRLYETFGNGGSADTSERTVTPDQTSRTWYRQNPPLPRVMWSLRNNNNYIQTGLLVSLSYVANNRRQLIDNFYEKSKRSILKARTEGPAAWVLGADDPSLGRQADLLGVLQKQHVEISRATAPFKVTVPKAQPREFPAGSYVIRMDQPFSRAADAMLDYQYWSPAETVTPYDDTGWTFPEGFGVQAARIVDPAVLDVPMERVSGPIRAPGGAVGTGALFAINNNADNQLATLRYQLKDADIQAVEEPFDAEGRHFNRGTFLVRAVPGPTLDTIAKELGLKAYALASAPASKTHPVRAARVAIIHTWTSTQTEGWWRIAFDQLRIPYDYISPQDIAKTPDLQCALGRPDLSARRRERARADRGHADVGPRPGAVEGLTRHAEPRHARTDRRHPPGIDLAGAHHAAELREAGRRVRCRDELHRTAPVVRAHTRGRHEPDPREHDGQELAAAHAAGGRDQSDRVRRGGQPRGLQQRRPEFQRERRRRWTRAWRRTRAAARTHDGDGTAGRSGGHSGPAGLRTAPAARGQRSGTEPRAGAANAGRVGVRARFFALPRRRSCSCPGCSTAAATSQTAPISCRCPWRRVRSCCSRSTRCTAARPRAAMRSS